MRRARRAAPTAGNGGSVEARRKPRAAARKAEAAIAIIMPPSTMPGLTKR
jgi:hypothetical protein